MQKKDTDASASEVSEPKELGEMVAEHFLAIFRQQLKASPYAPSECRLLGFSGLQNNRRTYELRIQLKEEWRTRRMTLTPLGEGSGSKSSCFYVIYDDHLVVKIPPVPLTDFSKYIDSLQAEQTIANRLAPRVCITPSVSVIMERTFPFDEDAEEMAPEAIESAYINWLNDTPEAQRFLMINDGFVFFMDLARYFILADVLDSMHGRSRDSVEAEITGNASVILDLQGFEGRYGHGTAHIGEALSALFSDYDVRLRKVFETKKRISAPAIQYKFLEWFAAYLAGQPISPETENAIPPEVIPDVNAVIKTVLNENVEAVAAYRETIRRFLLRTSFSRARTKMSGIITNILDLLAYLKRKHVSMRDFKPDNVLVAGDPGRYPQFLSTADAFFLGLIDVETALIIDPDSESLPQPRLGGTPFFATPSQLVTNDLLEKAFGDVRTIFFLQDWYAAMAMIYKVVTDDNLFRQTAKIMPVIIRAIQKAAREKKFDVSVVETVSRSFWQNAVAEYRRNVSEREKMLRAVQMVVPRTANSIMAEIFQAEKDRIEARVKALVADQPYYKNDKNKIQLVNAVPDKLMQLIDNIPDAANEVEMQRNDGMRRFLSALIAEKKRLATCEAYIQQFQTKIPVQFAVFELMNIFFNHVFHRMFPPEWRSGEYAPLMEMPPALQAG